MYQPAFVNPQPSDFIKSEPKNVERLVVASQPKVVSASLEDVSKFIVLHTRDIGNNEVQLFQRYGKVLPFNAEIYNHLSPDEYKDQFDYLFLDIRQSSHRRYYERVDKSEFKVICIVDFFEKESSFLDDLECIVKSKLPPLQAFKKDFDALLLARTIQKPNKIISCLGFFLSIFKKYSGR
jgi:hypothetical protein